MSVPKAAFTVSPTWGRNVELIHASASAPIITPHTLPMKLFEVGRAPMAAVFTHEIDRSFEAARDIQLLIGAARHRRRIDDARCERFPSARTSDTKDGDGRFLASRAAVRHEEVPGRVEHRVIHLVQPGRPRGGDREIDRVAAGIRQMHGRLATVEITRNRNHEPRGGRERKPGWSVAEQDAGVLDRKTRAAYRHAAALYRAHRTDCVDGRQRSVACLC